MASKIPKIVLVYAPARTFESNLLTTRNINDDTASIDGIVLLLEELLLTGVC